MKTLLKSISLSILIGLMLLVTLDTLLDIYYQDGNVYFLITQVVAVLIFNSILTLIWITNLKSLLQELLGLPTSNYIKDLININNERQLLLLTSLEATTKIMKSLNTHVGEVIKSNDDINNHCIEILTVNNEILEDYNNISSFNTDLIKYIQSVTKFEDIKPKGKSIIKQPKSWTDSSKLQEVHDSVIKDTIQEKLDGDSQN